MAEILPLRAWRYADSLGGRMEELTAPLFDVVSSKQRDLLYENKLNSIHLSVPKGNDPGAAALKTLQEWKETGILEQDFLPGIYVYYQYFRLPGEDRERCRKGFIAQIKAYDWSERQILRHENTIVSAVNDRVDLLKKSKIQASPTHGLYEDNDYQLEKYMDESMLSPLYEIDDYQGVREILSVIHDRDVITFFLEVLRDKQVILADGHHRIEGSIALKNEMKGSYPDSKWKAHEYHLMYLTNAASDDLKILPTHRLFHDLNMSQNIFLEKLAEWFSIKKFGDAEEIGNYALHKPFTFGLVVGEESFVLELLPDKLNLFNQDIPEVIRELDLSVLHEVVFHQVLGLDQNQQRSSSQITYERNFSRCLREVSSGAASFALITRELPMSTVVEVCRSGYLMPQKSTYFYPKALSGLLFASIDQEEFNYEYDAFFGKSKR